MPMRLAGRSYRQRNLPSDAATPTSRLGGELHVLALPFEVDGDGRGVGRSRTAGTAGPPTTSATTARSTGTARAAGTRTTAGSAGSSTGLPSALPGTLLFQIVLPVNLSRATSVASWPPGVQMTLSPSTSGDSR